MHQHVISITHITVKLGLYHTFYHLSLSRGRHLFTLKRLIPISVSANARTAYGITPNVNLIELYTPIKTKACKISQVQNKHKFPIL